MPNPTTCTATPSQGATGNNGNVMGYLYQDAANTSLQHSAAYTFDGVNRLASATAKDLSSNTLWTQSYIFTTNSSNGQYGNMTCMLGGSGYCPQVTFSSSTNRVSKVGSLNANYDAAGNMTGDGTHTYQWDAEGRMTSVDSGSTATYKYNALGQRVERFLPSGSWTFDYPFGLNGEELGVYSAGGATWFGEDVPMGGRLLVQYGSPTQILHTNNLGTNTVTTDQTGAELQDQLFYPWGQQWTLAGQPYVMHFAGMHQLQDAGLYPTPNRDFTANLGRWMSPDPLAGNVTNPQSLNRYAYALNNPTTLTDPEGLSSCGGDDAGTEDTVSGQGVIHVDSWAPCPDTPVGVLPPQASEHPASSSHSSDGDYGEPPPPGPPKPPPVPWDLIIPPKCSDLFSLGDKGYHVTTNFLQVDASHSNPHAGIDFSAPSGTSITISFSGVVDPTTGPMRGFGNAIVIQKPTGVPGISEFILFGHGPTAEGIAPGEIVPSGTKIGSVGSLGHSTGPHVHVQRSFQNVLRGIKLQPCTP